MKWILLVMAFSGGAVTIPMDSQRACIDAKFKVEATMKATAICIQANE